MPLTTTDDVRIHFEVVGPDDGEPLVLVGGGGTQLVEWREPFCDLLVERGFRVIRFDHRDTGLSQRFGAPEDVDGGYAVQDMALDVLRVLDTLGLASAHVAGHSMGAIMGQYLALDHPARVRSLAVLSGIPGLDPAYLRGPQYAATAMVPQRPLPRDVAVEQFVATQRAMHATAFAFDEEAERAHAALQIDRGYEPNGFWRHISALLRADDRLPRLGSIRVPVTVVHGAEDPGLAPLAAELTAAAVPGAELHLVPGMGHRVEQALWPLYVDLIATNARRTV